jgi:hypothetical protein
MTKEEKVAEMARRKEERKLVRLAFAFFSVRTLFWRRLVGDVVQRIAQLKEQKKNAAGA